MADITSIVNTIRANGSTEYQTRVPVATRTNIDAVGNPILTYTAIQNEFLSALVNKIAFTVVQSKIWSNPLSILKKGLKPLGLDIENIHVNPAADTGYDAAGSTLLSTSTPDVKTEYFRLNRKGQYTVTIYREQLRHAFTSWENLGDLISAITNSLYSGDYIDEFILMKNVFAKAVKDQKMITAGITAITTEATAKDFIAAIKTAGSAMTYPGTSYNAFMKANPGASTAVTTWTPKENQILMIRSDILNYIDVNVLAAAFNMDKATFLGRVVEVDNFGEMSSINAILMDEATLQVWDDLSEMTEFYNPKGLYWNYYWNHWQTYAHSVFANCIAFVDDSSAPAAPVITANAHDAIAIVGTGVAGHIVFITNTTQGITHYVTVAGDGSWTAAFPATVAGDKLNAFQVDLAGNKSVAATEVTVS